MQQLPDDVLLHVLCFEDMVCAWSGAALRLQSRRYDDVAKRAAFETPRGRLWVSRVMRLVYTDRTDPIPRWVAESEHIAGIVAEFGLVRQVCEAAVFRGDLGVLRRVLPMDGDSVPRRKFLLSFALVSRRGECVRELATTPELEMFVRGEALARDWGFASPSDPINSGCPREALVASAIRWDNDELLEALLDAGQVPRQGTRFYGGRCPRTIARRLGLEFLASIDQDGLCVASVDADDALRLVSMSTAGALRSAALHPNRRVVERAIRMMPPYWRPTADDVVVSSPHAAFMVRALAHRLDGDQVATVLQRAAACGDDVFAAVVGGFPVRIATPVLETTAFVDRPIACSWAAMRGAFDAVQCAGLLARWSPEVHLPPIVPQLARGAAVGPDVVATAITMGNFAAAAWLARHTAVDLSGGDAKSRVVVAALSSGDVRAVRFVRGLLSGFLERLSVAERRRILDCSCVRSSAIEREFLDA